jgi:hypothetical protein
MASYKAIVITKKGQALMSKIMSGLSVVNFTKIKTSSASYSDASLEELTSLGSVQQESAISKIERIAPATVQLQVAITNRTLNTGYYVKTVGIYATDPDEGEILYAVMSADNAAWMPPYNGLSESSAQFNLSLTVGNADNVSVQVSGSAVVTQSEFQERTSAFLSAESDGVYINYTK